MQCVYWKRPLLPSEGDTGENMIHGKKNGGKYEGKKEMQ